MILEPAFDGVLREDLEYESALLLLFDRECFCSVSFNVNFDIILCNRPPFLGVS
jgi:hypothetical protein